MPPSASAQGTPAGTVVALQGTVTVTRASLDAPAPLRFKDPVFLHDRVATGEQSVTRLLLGGKAVVTVREHSVLNITEIPGTSTVNLARGRISVAVAKDRMKPGETVEIRTVNAIAAIRGTVVVAEVEPGPNATSTITVLRGLIDVTRLDGASGHGIGPAVPVAALQSVTVRGPASVPLATAIEPEAAQKLTSDFKVIPKTAPRASLVPMIAAQVELAKQEAAAVVAKAVVHEAKGKAKPPERAVASRDKEDGANDGDARSPTASAPAASAQTMSAAVVSVPAIVPVSVIKVGEVERHDRRDRRHRHRR